MWCGTKNRFIPSTISSESSRKNSLSGGRLGLFNVLSSCCILVETRLCAGTPVDKNILIHLFILQEFELVKANHVEQTESKQIQMIQSGGLSQHRNHQQAGTTHRIIQDQVGRTKPLGVTALHQTPLHPYLFLQSDGITNKEEAKH